MALFRFIPFSVAYFRSRKLQKKVFQKLESQNFQRIIVSSSSMAEYVRLLTNIPKMIDFMDVDSAKWACYADAHSFPLSWIFHEESVRLERYEIELGETFDSSIFVSEREASLFKGKVKEASVSVISNGVDLEYFRSEICDISESQLPNLVFLGAMDYFPNVDAVKYFCRDIFPIIRNELPHAKFFIVGRNPTSQVRALGRQQNITVTGSVSDIRPYLAKAMVTVVPLRIAGGIQNKVLESLASGIPVVCTPKAIQGTFIAGENGVLVTENSKEFAKQVLTLIGNAALRKEFSLQGRAYVEKFHRWDYWNTKFADLMKRVK